ncbi:MAG: PIN domain-containing protein [Chloroflexi bacterium]|nr:PIN domain-containing protein [Chloroflexota bacterium]
MRRIFVDSSYYIAVIDPRDRNHARTLATMAQLIADGVTSFVTSEPILFEVLAYFARASVYYKTRAATMVEGTRLDPAHHVIAVTPDLLDRAIALYKSRADQPYSLTDCASMEICRRLKITDVLTADTDFRNEGFDVLLHD